MLVNMGSIGSEKERASSKMYVEKYWRDDGRGELRGPPVPGRVDWVVAAVWALLTAHHCLGLSTGLFARWKVYYTPSSTLVRLLALQGVLSAILGCDVELTCSRNLLAGNTADAKSCGRCKETCGSVGSHRDLHGC